MADAHEIFDRTPVNRFLGHQLVSRSADIVELRLPVREELLQEEGVVHGGVLTSLADTAAVRAKRCARQSKKAMPKSDARSP